jgi:hypothetical protein
MWICWSQAKRNEATAWVRKFNKLGIQYIGAVTVQFSSLFTRLHIFCCAWVCKFMWSDSFGSHCICSDPTISVRIPLYLFGSYYICSDPTISVRIPLYLLGSNYICSDPTLSVRIHRFPFGSYYICLVCQYCINLRITYIYKKSPLNSMSTRANHPDLSNSWSRIRMHDELRY